MDKTLFEWLIDVRSLSKLKVAMEAGIPPFDLYLAQCEKIPFPPAWRKALCIVLDIDEDLLFPFAGKKE